MNVYPAIFTPCEEGGFAVHFPDLPGAHTEGDDLADALSMAREALAMWLDALLDDHKPFPSAGDPSSVALKDGQFVSLVDVDLVAYRRHKESRAVKKTLTIPSWLNYEAEQANAPFSEILQRGLKEYLRISDG